MLKQRVNDPKQQNTVCKPIDKVNRVYIPQSYLNRVGVARGDDVTVTSTHDSIIITPRVPACIICGSKESLQKCRNGFLCTKCVEPLKKSDLPEDR